jgi:hypothetical protein
MQDGNPLREYLSPDLTIKGMFEHFADTHGEDYDGLEWLYREVYNSQPIRIGCPRSDTCATCDRLFIARTGINPDDGNQRERLERLELQTISHHHDAEVGYQELRDDSERSRNDEAFVTICVDMQAVSNDYLCATANN